jgi:hypothetical protein
MSLEKLHNEIIHYGLNPANTRKKCIDIIIGYLENYRISSDSLQENQKSNSLLLSATPLFPVSNKVSTSSGK